MSFDNLILIEDITCSAISIGIAVWLPFKLRRMRRQREAGWVGEAAQIRARMR